ncbi:NUDIX domain-containing protein [Micromonospora sp. NPDC003197]
MTTNEMPPVATPRVAAGALFFDTEGRVLLVKPTYVNHWEIPGGHVEPGESPRVACIREIQEELDLTVDIGPMLVVDWAPAPNDGDKLLFIFDAGTLSEVDQQRITFADDELNEWRFVAPEALDGYVPDRLARRIRTACDARSRGANAYAEHGVEPF